MLLGITFPNLPAPASEPQVASGLHSSRTANPSDLVQPRDNFSSGKASLSASVNVSSLPSMTQYAPTEASPGGSGIATTNIVSASEVDPSSSIVASTSQSSVDVAIGFRGIYDEQPGVTTGSPPDPQIAAGPDYVLEMTNYAGEIYSKQGLSVKNFTLFSFFNVSTSARIGDPRVLFDSSSGAWFASTFACLPSSTICTPPISDNVTIAVSADNNPLGVWRIYSLQQATDLFTDQPVIGVSADKFVASANVYTDYHGTTYLGAEYWVLNKGEMVGGSSTVDFSSFGPDPALESVHPVEAVGPSNTLYMVSTGGADITANDSAVEVFSVSGAPPGQVTVDSMPLHITTIIASPFASQPCCESFVTIGVPIDTGQGAAGPGDFRVQSAVWFQNRLWLALNDGCTPAGDSMTRSCFRLVQLDTSKSPIVVDQDFDVGARHLYYYYPSLAVDDSGNLVVIYGYSNSTTSPGLEITGQAVDDPPSTVAQPRVLIPGVAPSTSCALQCSYVRYGDYFGTGLDGSNSTLIWVAGEYVGRLGGDWSTFLAGVSLTPKTSASDFQITPTANVLALSAGKATTTRLVLNSLNAFVGTVSLSTSEGPTGFSVSLSQTNVSLNATQPGQSTLTVATIGSTDVTNFVVTVTGRNGLVSHSLSIFVYVVGFRISISPSAVLIPSGSSEESTATLIAANGFYGSVSLSGTTSSPDLFVSITAPQVTLKGGTASSNLTFYTASFAPAGVFALNLTVSSQFESHSILIPVAVTPVVINTSDVTVLSGVSVKTTCSLSLGTSSSGVSLSGAASVLASDSTTGTSLLTRNYTITNVPLVYSSTGNYQAVFLLYVPVAPYPLSSDIRITYSGVTTRVAANLTRELDIDLDGAVDQSDLGILLGALGSVSGGPSYQARADLDASGAVNASDLSIISAYVGATDLLPDFSVSATSTALTVLAGFGTTTDIMVTSINGFLGSVSLAFASSPSGPVLSIGEDQVTLLPDDATSLLLSLSTTPSTAPGTYEVNVTGGSGQLSHSFVLTVRVVDFHVFITPSSMTVFQGSSSSFYVVVNSVASFSGSVGLTVSSVVENSPVASLAATNVSLNGPGSAVITSLNMTAFSTTSPQIYDVTVTGAYGSLLHSVALSITVPTPDFSIAGQASPIFVAHGTEQRVLIYTNSINGFTGNVSLSAETLPMEENAPTISFILSRTAQCESGRSRAFGACTMSGLLIDAINSPPENYTLTITGTSGSLHHQLNETLEITDFNLAILPTNEVVPAGRSGSVSIDINAVNGYTILLTFYLSSISGLPSCASSNIRRESQSFTVSLKVGADCPASTNVVTIVGTDGGTRVSHSAYFTFTVSEFQLNTSPDIIGLSPGLSSSVTVDAASVNDYPSSWINLSVLGLPPCITASLSPSGPMMFQQGASNSTRLTVTTGPSCTSGTFTITIQGDDTLIVRNANFTLIIGSSALTASPDPTYAVKKSEASITVTVSPFNGVTDRLSLSVSGAPACVKMDFNPDNISLPYGGSTVLSLTVGAHCSEGSFTLTVTAKGNTVLLATALSLVLKGKNTSHPLQDEPLHTVMVADHAPADTLNSPVP